MATESRRKGIKLVIALCVIVALAVTGVLIWTSRRATVRFYSEVESNIENISVSIGGTIDQPKDPVAKDPGYSFGGWYSDPNYLTEFDFDLPIQKDTTVYVKWVRRSFTVTVLRATTGGNFYEVLWTGSAKYKESISLPGTSTFMNYSWMGADDARQYPFRRANQNFLGFATRDNGIGDYNYTYLPDSSFTIPNTSVQLYAVFRGDERSFIFNPNDGEGSEKTEKGYFNENFTVPTSEGLSKKYYTFAYWCTNADGIPRDSEGNPLADVVDPVTGEVTEKAENNENCVNVYWPGQTFKINNTEPMTLYAIWRRNKVNIMIDARGGSNSLGTDGDNLVDAGLEGGYDLSTITKPTRDGYRLISYNTQENGLGTTYSLDAVLQVEEEDIALYAIWQRHLTVGYTLNTNKASDDKLTEAGGYEDFVGIDGESFTVKDIPVTVDIPNFSFLGWDLDSEATQAEYHSGDTFVLRESDFDGGVDKIYLYGIWQGDARVLRLKNTSNNQFQEIKSSFGRMERLSYTREHVDPNYEFIGWGTVEEYNYKNPDSYTGRIYEVGSQFEMGTNTEIGESRDILYSLWCPYSYDITYYTQGGRLTAISAEDQANGYYIKDYVYKETITLYSQVEREGYRFMGWAYSSNSQECAFPTEGENGYTLVMPGNPIQLYAVWQKEYTVTFYNNADDASGLVTAITGKILGETITIPTEEVSNTGITRDNYTIIGWGSKPDGGTVYEFGVEVVLESSDMISYYAIWQGNARYVEVYNGVTKVATIEGHYGESIPLAFEEEITDADPGQEIGGFYAMLKPSPTAEPIEKTFAYGDGIKTTTLLYFNDETGAPSDTLKVYIEWTNKYFSVVYELNGGIYNNDDNDDMSAYRIYKQYTTEVTLESGIPTKTRYEFKGWTETPDDDNPVLYAAGGKFVIPSHDVTLYAYWARIYSINFNSNGGTLAEGADESDLKAGSYSKGTNFIMPNNVYERTNYTFKCWSTKASGATGAGGEDYNVGDTLTITSDITLYAVWQGQEVNVTLISVDPGNAAYETRTVQITPTPRYGDTISLGTYSSVIPAPDQGLTLKGWVIGRQPTELDIEVEYTNDYTIDSVGNIEIYAVWSAKKFYFTVGLSGGVCNNSYSDQAESYAFRQQIDMTYYSNRIKKEGYRLIGYSNTANATEADYAVNSVISMPNASKKVFCVWIELAIITFDKNCESDTLENYVFEGVPNDAIDGEINLTNVNKMFTRDNYTLLGWSTSSTATTPDAGFSIDNDTYRILSTQDIHLFAVWEGRAIQVVFNANGGQGSNTQEQRKYGDVIDLTVDKYKRTHSDEGFSFGGWSRVAGYDNANSAVGSSFTVSTDKITDASITLYAIWNKRYFTLTLSYGDSTLGSKANPDGYDSRQVQYTSTIDLTQYVTQAKKRLGYDFLGWAENQYETNASKIYGAPDADGNPTNVEFTMPNSAVTLYALWNPIYVDIIYISDTPSGATATWSGVTPGVQSYTSQELYQLSFKLPSNKITESVSVVVPTYRFVGWILDGDSTQTIRKEGNWLQVSSRSPMTLRAQWEENRITVAVNGNGGIFVDSNSGTQQVSIKEMSAYTLPTAVELVRAGYRLSGYTVGGNRYDLAANPTIQITTSLIDQADIASNTVRITMLWIQQFTVSFNANNKYNDGTTGSIDDKTVDSGTAIVLPNCSAAEGFNRPHYKFLYWNTEPDGKGTTYNAGISVTVYASYTLYAIWEGDDRQITLNFSTNKVGKWSGGDVTTKTFTGLKYGDKIDLGKTDYTGECTENAGFKLGGWTDIPYDASKPSAFNVKFLFGSIYTVEGDDASPNIQLYAVWEARSYKVSYDTNGGVFSDGSNRKDGAEIAYGNNFTVDGSFVGYNPSATKQFYTLVGWSIDRNFDWNKKNTRPTSWQEPSITYNYVVKSGDTSSEKAGFVMPSKDVVLYAIWEPVPINISIYNDKDSMGTVSDPQTVRYGDTYTLRTISEADAAQIKPDHNFDKWQHLNTDKSTILGSYAGGTTLKITEELMSENEATANPKTIIFVGTWIPQTVYFIIDGNEGLFGENNTYTVQSSVGREIVLPKVKETDSSYQLTRENFALDSFNTTRNGSGAVYKPGATIQIPSLNDSRVKEETITFGDEEITTYVFRVYAQWQEAEAYIYLSDTRKENPFYKTLGEAIDDAATGNRVIIIKDCYIKSKITISKSVTIEAEDSDKTIYRYIGTEDNSFADAYKGVCIEVTTTGQLNVGVNSEDYEGPVIYFDGQSGKYTTVVESFIVLKGSATIYNGVVFRNTYAATGGVFSVDDTNASLVLKYVSFDTNMADGNGGAIAITRANNISISNSNFYGNVSKTGFGGAISNNGTTQVKNSVFENNKASAAAGGGGAIYNAGDMFEDDSNTYISNSTRGKGGAVHNAGSLMTITSSIFTKNTAVSSGGAVYNAATTSASNNLIIKDVVFGNVDDDTLGNSSNNYGGAITNSGKLSIMTSLFYYNKAQNGGALYNDGSSASLSIVSTANSRTIFQNNSATGSGGAINIQSAFTINIGEEGVPASTVYFEANTVGDGKGHSLAVTGSSVVNIYTATFIATEYTGDASDGGVIYQNQGTLNIYGADVNNNVITNGYGGGLYLAGGTCKITSISVHNNVAKYGGGIAVSGNARVTIENAEIYANTALLGGGIYIKDNGSTVTLTSNAAGGQTRVGISADNGSNIATADGSAEIPLGGGIYNNGKLTIAGGIVQNNTSEGNAGGIYNASKGVLTLISGSIINNISSLSGGGVYCAENGVVTFACSSSIRMLIEGNLCADGAYMLGEYDKDGSIFANGIYITNTKVIISGYIMIGLNGDETILNDIFLSRRDESDKPTKIVEYSSSDSVAQLSDNTHICISSVVAIMGDKLVKFPSNYQAKNNIAKFSFAGDEAGFRVLDSYLILGNYAATIVRDGKDVYYQSLTEAYLDAKVSADGTPETIFVYKNIKLVDDLKVYETNPEANDAQEALLSGITHDSITSTFYIAKKVVFAPGGDYTISRNGLEGDMFTIVGNGQLTLGVKTPISGAMLTLQGAKDEDITTGSIIKVEENTRDDFQLIVYNGVKLTKNKAEKGGAIYSVGSVQLKGGEITNNVAESDEGGKGGAIYSEGYIEMIESPTISLNRAYDGAGIYINNVDCTINALYMNSKTATISENRATNGGGGIYINNGLVTVAACNINKNYASVNNGSSETGGGGAIYVNGGSENTKLVVATAVNTHYESEANKIQITRNESETNGGAIVVNNATFDFQNGHIENNNANGKGGAIALINATPDPTRTLFTTMNTNWQNVIAGNEATNGGAIAVIKGTAQLKQIRIGNNRANGDGGALFVEDKLELYKNANIGYSGNNGSNFAGGNGGGIYITRTGSMEIKEPVNVGYNEAVAYGGGIANAGSAKLEKINIFSNKALAGGGVANLDSNSNIVIDGSMSIYANTATSTELGGGGIYNNGVINVVMMNGSSYVGGGQISEANTSYNGGGIYNSGKLIFKRTGTVTTFHALYVRNNTATIYGGGIYNTGTIENYLDYQPSHFCNLIIDGNRTLIANAGGGGGLCNNGGTIESMLIDDPATKTFNTGAWLHNIRFTSNQTGGYGGGLLILDGTAHMIDAYYQKNTASYGGAVAVISGELIDGYKDKYVTYGSQYDQNAADSGNDLYLRVAITFNSNLNNVTDVYLANSKAYLKFNPKWHVEKQTWYANNTSITVDAVNDGRRVAQFGFYTELQQLTDGAPKEEVTVYYADEYYLRFHLTNSEEGYGLSVDDFGYIVITEPVCFMGQGSPNGHGKYYSTIAAAVNDIPTEGTGNILILKSHTIDQEIVIVNKYVRLYTYQNVILTASKRLKSKSMFFIFSTNTDRTWKTTKYWVEFNYSSSNTTFQQYKNGAWTDVYRGPTGKAASVTMTFDGNRGALKVNDSGAKAISVRSGAYYTETETFNGSTRTVYKPYTTGWGYNNAYSVSDAVLERGLKINNQDVVRQVITADDGTVYSSATNFGTTLNQLPAMYDINICDCEFNNFQTGYGGAIATYLYSDNATNSYNTSYSPILSLYRSNFDNNFQRWYHSHEDTYTYYIGVGGGSCINASGGRLRIEECKFTNNLSYMSGGAIQARWQTFNKCTNLSKNNINYWAIYINKSTFDNNRAYSGGAIQMTAVQGIVYLGEGNTFNENSASLGGAIRYHSSITTTEDFINRIQGYPISVHNTGSNQMNHVEDTSYNSLNYLYIGSGNIFSGNYTTTTGYYDRPTCWGPNAGGAIYANNNIRDYGATYKDNSATSGGAIYATRYIYMRDSKFNNNSAVSGDGGAMNFQNACIKYFFNIKADGNSASGSGGALLAYTNTEAFVITGQSTSFTNNYAANNGGAIYWHRDYSRESSRIKDCFIILKGEFDGNSAGNIGGAIFTSTACESNNPNSYNSTPAETGFGGISAADWKNVDYRAYIWSSVVITNNKAGNAGGGIYAYHNLVLYNVYLTGNEVYNSSSYGGGAGVYANTHLDIIQGTIQNNSITAENKGSGMGGGGVHCRGLLSLGTGYSEINSLGISVYGDGTYSFNEKNIFNTYHSPWEGKNKSSGDTKSLRRDTSVDLYLVLKSEDSTSVKIAENSCESSSGVSNGDGTGIFVTRPIYIEWYIGITDQVYTTNKVYLSSRHIYFRDTINFLYGTNPTANGIFIERCSTNNLISSEIRLMNLVNTGWTLAWGTGSNSRQVTFQQSSLKIAAYANGWIYESGTYRRIGTDDGAKLANGMYIQNATISYNTNAKNLYNQIVPRYSGYSFYQFVYFNGNTVTSTTTPATSGAHKFSYNSDNTFDQSTINRDVPKTAEGEALDVYVIWSPTSYTVTMYKYFPERGQDAGSKDTNDNPNQGGSYTYTIKTGEKFETIMNDFETAPSTVPNAKEGWTKSYYKGYELQYYMDYTSKKVYKKDDLYPYPSNMTLRAVYSRRTYTMTFLPGDFGTPNYAEGANILKVKYGSRANMLSANNVLRSGYKLVGWIDNNGKEYNLTTNYTAGTSFTENITLTPKWEAVPYDLRLYYNYPDGGTSFMILSIYAGDTIKTNLSTFTSAPVGYELEGFSFDAEGEQMIDNTTVMPSENTIIYAQWRARTVTIVFYDKDGNRLDMDIECKYGEEIELPELPGNPQVKLWENLGDGIYYSEGSSFLVNSMVDRYLTFRMYVD